MCLFQESFVYTSRNVHFQAYPRANNCFYRQFFTFWISLSANLSGTHVKSQLHGNCTSWFID